jgi:hypothetical protein
MPLLAVIYIVLLSPAYTQPPTRFAVIGDYGLAGQPELDVANLVKSWNPDFVLTLGDNNYELGAASTIDQNIGQYYHQFISPYLGAYGQGDSVSRFFPSLGNHDWIAAGAAPYLGYFSLPGNERYYNVSRGPVEFFVVDSDTNEPDGSTALSAQGQWLQAALGSSSALWKLVLFHHPPYSSGTHHGSTARMQWPFQAWGATAVLSGHEHNYEKIIVGGFPYFVNGLGGRSLYTTFGTPVNGSQIRYAGNYGAMLVEATMDSIRFRFITRTGTTIDSYTQYAPGYSTQQVSLEQGWNMVSLPVRVADASVSALFPSVSSQLAYFFTGTAYEQAEILHSGTGYWVKSDVPATISLFGETIHRDTITVSADWNLVGCSNTVVPENIIPDPPDILSSGFFGYKGSYIAADTLRSGKAYWIKITQPGKLIIGKP